ncbi:hypothetical protein OMP44_14915 [Pseudomonas sp. CBMAI 2609]|uniref:Uncharacterized protein n=1 Tax=Pseudomonas flavocrustae TaxID=2991719 RepID=A0ABT6II90_9PSED|nr:hypothetical protein [Pseudomonas sp. CBMAI 2609]MDH4764179.1 hypothetical protein [Pseudomonas sp. CBMAI 2609]
MNKSSLVQAVLGSKLLIVSSNLTLDERQALAEMLADLMGRETTFCISREQQDWLVAKAWSAATGKTRRAHRRSSFGNKVDFEKIRLMFSKLVE